MATETAADLAASFGDPRDLLVVLDFDGTLSPIVDDPDAAALAPGAYEAVQRLAGITEVAVLSGRHLDDLAPRVKGLPALLLGGHGTEVAEADGTRHSFVDLDERRPALDHLEADLRELLDPSDGWFVERKPASLAVHHRRVDAPDRGGLLTHPRERMARTDGDWELLDGKAVTELRPAGVDKGTAVAWLADRHPNRDLLVVGDDVTDEDAFRAARQRGGTAILVGAPERRTAAEHRLDGPEDVVAFLDALAAAGS